MIKIAYLTKNLAANGITNVALNYGLRLDKSRFQLTLIAGVPVEEVYRQKLAEEGIRLVELPPKKKNPLGYYGKIWSELKRSYDIVHVHGSSATITVEILLAKLAGVPVRIAHSHSVSCDHPRIHKALKPILKKLCSYGFACSSAAGAWLFGDGAYKVLPNAFQVEKFVFDPETRKRVRENLGIEQAFVIGNIARFNESKNHGYLLDVFEKVAEKRVDAVLLLVGNGPKLEEIKARILKHPYQERILYYGITDKPEELYAAMDVFALPTRYEGLGIVFVEAEISGLPAVASEGVPREVDIDGRVQFLPLTEAEDLWCEAILTDRSVDRAQFYETHRSEIMKYDIACSVKQLSDTYQRLVEEAGRRK